MSKARSDDSFNPTLTDVNTSNKTLSWRARTALAAGVGVPLAILAMPDAAAADYYDAAHDSGSNSPSTPTLNSDAAVGEALEANSHGEAELFNGSFPDLNADGFSPEDLGGFSFASSIDGDNFTRHDDTPGRSVPNGLFVAVNNYAPVPDVEPPGDVSEDDKYAAWNAMVDGLERKAGGDEPGVDAESVELATSSDDGLESAELRYFGKVSFGEGFRGAPTLEDRMLVAESSVAVAPFLELSEDELADLSEEELSAELKLADDREDLPSLRLQADWAEQAVAYGEGDLEHEHYLTEYHDDRMRKVNASGPVDDEIAELALNGFAHIPKGLEYATPELLRAYLDFDFSAGVDSEVEFLPGGKVLGMLPDSGDGGHYAKRIVELGAGGELKTVFAPLKTYNHYTKGQTITEYLDSEGKGTQYVDKVPGKYTMTSTPEAEGVHLEETRDANGAFVSAKRITLLDGGLEKTDYVDENGTLLNGNTEYYEDDRFVRAKTDGYGNEVGRTLEHREELPDDTGSVEVVEIQDENQVSLGTTETADIRDDKGERRVVTKRDGSGVLLGTSTHTDGYVDGVFKETEVQHDSSGQKLQTLITIDGKTQTFVAGSVVKTEISERIWDDIGRMGSAYQTTDEITGQKTWRTEFEIEGVGIVVKEMDQSANVLNEYVKAP